MFKGDLFTLHILSDDGNKQSISIAFSYTEEALAGRNWLISVMAPRKRIVPKLQIPTTVQPEGKQRKEKHFTISFKGVSKEV